MTHVLFTQRRVAAALFTTAACAALWVVRANASGIPASQPLFWGGTLEESGQLTTGLVPIGFRLFAEGGDTALCSVDSAPVDVVRGEFRVDVSACLAAVQTERDVEVELSVRGVAQPREPVGAVPYAVEAQRAQQSDVANAVAPDSVGTSGLVDGAVTRAKAPFSPRITLNHQGAARTDNLSVYAGSVEVAAGYATFLGIALAPHYFPPGTFSAPPLCVTSNGDAQQYAMVDAAVSEVFSDSVTLLLYDNNSSTGLDNTRSIQVNVWCTGPG